MMNHDDANRAHLVIQSLSARHDKSQFSCGVSVLDNYLHKQSGQDLRRNISRIFVAGFSDKPEIIKGYYTLSSLSIEVHDLPEHLAKKLPRQPVPAALFGRLAVDKTLQGKGVGGLLLADAMHRIMAVSGDIAIYAMVVDALNHQVKKFYQKFGFIPLSEHELRLFLPIRAIK